MRGCICPGKALVFSHKCHGESCKSFKQKPPSQLCVLEKLLNAGRRKFHFLIDIHLPRQALLSPFYRLGN